ncbi:MAG: prolipoprotein diacylglyceryl transferase [Candidatus Eremiobacteraeota bacterium]|nr:prolipoprotein diacylglyceryl transferase [Candidatus Eremiobacteraeota bacterium]MBV8365391.1 prolipoprotein diacylglyceryl transferase [Candidatus Eremiobacteraeota bacterium]
MMGLSAVCYGLGYLAGLAAFGYMARRRGIATTGIWTLMSAGLIGGLAGANLTQLIVTGSPGKTLLGGVICGYIAVVLTKRWLGIVRPTGDLFAMALAAGEAIGRWGCFFGQCCYGKIASHLPWAIYEHGAYRHPTQAYLALAATAIFVALWYLHTKPLPENALFYIQGTLFCAARFGIEFFREGPSLFAGLSFAQYACIAGLAFFGYKMIELVVKESTPSIFVPTAASR